MITYELGDNLYINLTNKCSNSCSFCIRDSSDNYLSHYNLWLDTEPSYDEFLKEIKEKDLKKYNEIVFCGYGEPTYRIDLMKQIAEFFHDKVIRLNTNGQGNLVNKRDIVPELTDFLDIISISLNGSTQEEYQKKCHSIYDKVFDEILDFAGKCVKNKIETRFSVVEGCVDNIDECKRIANSLGIELFIRKLA